MYRTNPEISSAVQSVAKSLCKPNCNECTSFRYRKRADMPFMIVKGRKLEDGTITIKYDYVYESDHDRLVSEYGPEIRMSSAKRRARAHG
jgi:hypothetical protein